MAASRSTNAPEESPRTKPTLDLNQDRLRNPCKATSDATFNRSPTSRAMRQPIESFRRLKYHQCGVHPPRSWLGRGEVLEAAMTAQNAEFDDRLDDRECVC